MTHDDTSPSPHDQFASGGNPLTTGDEGHSTSTRGDYTVGYGRPPEGSRFQPGRSGNPKGRPRGDLAFTTLLRRELEERVSVKEQGRRHKLSKRGVIVKRLVSEAMAGNPKHLAIVLAQDPVAAAVIDEVTTALTRPADAAVKADLIRRLRAAAVVDESPSPAGTDVHHQTPSEHEG